VTEPQRRNGHARTSVGYFLVHDNGRRGLLWGRVTSDTGRASKASRLAAQTGLRTFAVIGHRPARFPPRGRFEQQTESFIIKDATGRGGLSARAHVAVHESVHGPDALVGDGRGFLTDERDADIARVRFRG
jgi:hypothetical protein